MVMVIHGGGIGNHGGLKHGGGNHGVQPCDMVKHRGCSPLMVVSMPTALYM